MRRRLTVCALAVGLLLAACGGGSTRPGPVRTEPPVESRRVTCEVETDRGPATFGLDLPEAFVPLDGRSCTWMRTETRGAWETIVEIRSEEPGVTLKDEYDDLEPRAGEFSGDESIEDLQLDRGVATFGRTQGDRLSYLCYCDGQNVPTSAVQSGRVRVGWTSDVSTQKKVDALLERALEGAGTVD